jgi:Tol biopolymer transport system component
MTSPRRFEQDLPALLADLYVAGIPDYRDDLVQRVAVTSQRAAWTIPERWIPMDIATTRVPVARMPWRQLGVLALLTILLAAAVALYVGSRQEPLPAPFGPAANGLVVYSTGGDIFTANPSTGSVDPIVTGPEDDIDPRFSRDGTRIVFSRKVEGASMHLFVAGNDGADLTQITPRPISLTSSLQGEPWEQYQFSPDGRSVLIALADYGVAGIAIAQADGSGVRSLEVGMPAYEPTWRPPDGREIMFVGYANGPGISSGGVYAVDVASGAVRTIVEPLQDHDLAAATWSPDGSHVAYWRWGGANVGINAKTHVVAADGSGGRELPVPEGAVWNTGTEWSNDGTRLVVSRGYTDAFDTVRTAIVPSDGSTTGDELEIDGVVTASCCVTWEWAPDDSKILVTPMGAGGVLPQVVIDVAAGTSSPATWDTKSDPAWQRRAR